MYTLLDCHSPSPSLEEDILQCRSYRVTLRAAMPHYRSFSTQDMLAEVESRTHANLIVATRPTLSQLSTRTHRAALPRSFKSSSREVSSSV